MILDKKPLLLSACEAGILGALAEYPGGAFADAGFIYLRGTPRPDLFDKRMDKFKGRVIVCMSEDWEAFITENHPELVKSTRWQMTPLSQFNIPNYSLPDGYKVARFGKSEFDAHPFYHGMRYPDWETFSHTGSGAVVYFGDEIAASCSSYISLNGEVELDISTSPDHRRKGLAMACASEMLKDCQNRGIIVHWDAQNPESKHIAEKFGYTVECEYNSYWFPNP